jgi:hypothetical protein
MTGSAMIDGGDFDDGVELDDILAGIPSASGPDVEAQADVEATAESTVPQPTPPADDEPQDIEEEDPVARKRRERAIQFFHEEGLVVTSKPRLVRAYRAALNDTLVESAASEESI